MSLFDLSKLADPFPADDIEWRLAQCGEKDGKFWGMCLAYISARAISDRLDAVVGPQNWQVSYQTVNGHVAGSGDLTISNVGGVICRISIKINDEWVYKEDGAEQTDIESFKGGISSAFKRAGSAWGIGRYLYRLESGFARIVDKSTAGAIYGQTKDRKTFYWLPPQLPSWALPKGKTAPAPAASPSPKTRIQLITEIMANAKRLDTTEADLAAWAFEMFKKPAENLSVEELSQFLEVVSREPGREAGA